MKVFIVVKHKTRLFVLSFHAGPVLQVGECNL